MSRHQTSETFVSCELPARESRGEGKGEKWTEDGWMWEVMKAKENHALKK